MSARRSTEPARPDRVMSIHAHPDDQEFTVGGTLAKWARAGSEIVTVCLTSGEAGSNRSTPPDMTRERLVKIREEEQRAACQVLGIADVVFLGYTDGVLEPTIALRRDLTRVVRRFRPDAVVCGDPTVRFYGNRYLNHPDHRVAADIALDAVFPSAETRFIFPELLDEGWRPTRSRACSSTAPRSRTSSSTSPTRCRSSSPPCASTRVSSGTGTRPR